MQAAKTRSKNVAKESPALLKIILKEIRGLRQDVDLLLPQEDLKDYAHPTRIKKSFRNAIKKFPPLAV